MYSKVSRLTFTLQTDTTKSCYNLHSTCICICSTCSGLLLCLSVKYLSPLGQCCIACVVVIWSQCCGSVGWADWQSQKLGANAHRLVVHHIKNPCRRLHQNMLLQIRCETLLWLWTTCACQRRFPATLVNNGGQRRSVICEHKIQLQEGPVCHIPSTICTARRCNSVLHLQQNSKCVQYGDETMNRRQKEDVIMQHTTIQAQCNRVLPIF